MFIHIWRMRARKKRVEDYEKFGRQVTLPSLKKIDGCVGAHFIKIFQGRKPEYLWLVFWRDYKALEQARTNPLWREQIKRFEAGKYYKSIPVELVCEALESFSEYPAKPKRAAKTGKTKEAASPEASEAEKPAPKKSSPGKAAKSAPPEEPEPEKAAPKKPSPVVVTGPMVEGE